MPLGAALTSASHVPDGFCLECFSAIDCSARATSAERDKREHYKRRAARLAKSPAHARRKSQNTNARKDEKIFPDGQNSINVAGLGAEEHLAAIHADQFHRLLRADSFDDFQDM